MYTPVSTSSHRRTNRVNVPVYVCLPVCVHTVRSKLYTCVALQSHCWASIFCTGGTFYSLSVIALSPPTATIYPMLPLEEGSLFEFPHPMPTPTSPFFVFFYVPVFFERGFPCLLGEFGESGSGTVAIVGQQNPLRHCIWYWSVQINLTWLVCNCIIVTYAVCQPVSSCSQDLLLFVPLSAC